MKTANTLSSLTKELFLAAAMAFGLGQTQKINAQTPDTKSKIIFTDIDYKRPDSTRIHLNIVNYDGTGFKTLSDSVGYYYSIYYGSELTPAAFSPDGTMIAYFTSSGTHKIIDTTGKELFSFKGKGLSEEDFNWTSDSKALYFGSYVDGIYKFDLDKNAVIQVMKTIGYTYDGNPVVSPDQKKIILTHHEYGSIFYEDVIDIDGTNKRRVASSFGKDTIYSKHDQPLNNLWLDNQHIIYNVSSPRMGSGNDVIGYADIDSTEGKKFILDPNDAFVHMELSQDREKLALVSPYDTLRFVNIASFNNESLDITKTNISRTLAFDFSSDNNIFCVSDDGLGSNTYPYEKSEGGLFAYDENMNNENMNRHIILKKKDAPVALGDINYVDWNSAPINAEDLGPIDTMKYYHNLGGYTSSAVMGKMVVDSIQIYLSKAPGDTTWTTTKNNSYGFKWKSIEQKQTVTVGSKNIPGHMPSEAVTEVGDYGAGEYGYASLRFPGLTYGLTQPIHVQNKEDRDVSGVNISGYVTGDSYGPFVTGIDGRADIIKENLETNQYNLPHDKYTMSVKLSSPFIQAQEQYLDAVVGTNPEVLINVFQLATAVDDKSLESKLMNYPNPFNESTTVKYNLQKVEDAKLVIYTTLGEKVFEVVEKNQTSGPQQIRIDGANLKSGMYIYELHAGDNTSVGKMIKE